MNKKESTRHLPTEEMDLFLLFEEVADWAWDQVESWKPRHQDTIGRPLVRSADSVGANLVEGDGRYTDPDALHFFVVARASAREARLWIRRSAKRKLVASQDADRQVEKLTRATRLLNLLVGYRRRSVSSGRVREIKANYLADTDPFVEPILDKD